MLNARTRKRIINLREMAMMVVEEADEVLRLEEPGSSLQGSKKNEGLSDEQRAKLLMKRQRSRER